MPKFLLEKKVTLQARFKYNALSMNFSPERINLLGAQLLLPWLPARTDILALFYKFSPAAFQIQGGCTS